MLTSTYNRETLVERITYTASLVTQIKEVDPYLDKLRSITSHTAFSPQSMSDRDYSALLTLQEQLEQYLIEHETLRSFTRDSLHIQIEQHLAGNRGAQRGLLYVVLISVLALMATGLVAILPVMPRDEQQHIILAGAVATSILNLGAAWLFLNALPAFTSQLRRAFVFICVGIALFSLSILTEPLVELLNLRATSDITTLVIMPIVFLSVLSMYIGIVKYATLTGVKSRLLRPRLLFVLAIPLIAVVLLVHGSNEGSKYILGFSLILHAWIVLLTIVSVILLAKIVRRAADLYKPPVRALLQAIIVLMAGTLIFAGVISEAGPRLTNPMAIGLFTFLLIMGGMLVRAGYTFNKISRY